MEPRVRRADHGRDRPEDRAGPHRRGEAAETGPAAPGGAGSAQRAGGGRRARGGRSAASLRRGPAEGGRRLRPRPVRGPRRYFLRLGAAELGRPASARCWRGCWACGVASAFFLGCFDEPLPLKSGSCRVPQGRLGSERGYSPVTRGSAKATRSPEVLC